MPDGSTTPHPAPGRRLPPYQQAGMRRRYDYFPEINILLNASRPKNSPVMAVISHRCTSVRRQQSCRRDGEAAIDNIAAGNHTVAAAVIGIGVLSEKSYSMDVKCSSHFGKTK